MSSNPNTAGAPQSAPPKIPTPQIVAAMVRKSKQVSDLIFSPGSAPRMELNGQLVKAEIPGLESLKPDDTTRIAADLIGQNKLAIQNLRELGSCDVSYSLPELARFRVNVFMQRGTCAIVMRVIPNSIPAFADLNLPPQLGDCAELRNGVVLVTGPTSSGKSSTLAAILDRINEQKAYHIITIEDPIEFLHRHKKSIIHQRELHSDTPSFALALRAALRQAPKVILVGEMRDKETIEIARRPPRQATWFSPRCTPLTRHGPSSASSAHSRSAISRQCVTAWPRVSAISSRSDWFHAKKAKGASASLKS